MVRTSKTTFSTTLYKRCITIKDFVMENKTVFTCQHFNVEVNGLNWVKAK